MVDQNNFFTWSVINIVIPKLVLRSIPHALHIANVQKNFR